MAADFTGDTADGFIVAQHAQWAGDFDHALMLYFQIAQGSRATSLPPLTPLAAPAATRQRISNSDALLRSAAVERFNGLTAKIREFNTIRSRFPAPYDAVQHTPVVLTGRHLRGAVWRTTARDFVLRAYLTTLAKAGDLKFRVGEAYRRGEHDVEETIAPDTRDEGDPIIESGGLTWSVPGDPFISVTFSDLGLVEAKAFWSSPTPPSDFSVVRTPLQDLFDSLDPT